MLKTVDLFIIIIFLILTSSNCDVIICLSHYDLRGVGRVYFPPFFLCNRIGGVMVSVLSGAVLASSVVDRGFEPWSGQTKDYKIGICCFSAKHAVLRRKIKDGLARNQNKVSEWSDMCTRRLFQ